MTATFDRFHRGAFAIGDLRRVGSSKSFASARFHGFGTSRSLQIFRAR